MNKKIYITLGIILLVGMVTADVIVEISKQIKIDKDFINYAEENKIDYNYKEYDFGDKVRVCVFGKAEGEKMKFLGCSITDYGKEETAEEDIIKRDIQNRINPKIMEDKELSKGDIELKETLISYEK